MKINLSCGTDIRPFYVNVDKVRLTGVNVVHDLSLVPLPFADGCAEEVLCVSLLEHITPLVPLIRDIHRVLEPGGRAVFLVPHFTSVEMFEDPTHRNFFSCETFTFFTVQSPRPYYFDFAFSRLESLRLTFPKRRLFALSRPIERAVNASEWLRVVYESSALRSLFPASSVEAVLVK